MAAEMYCTSFSSKYCLNGKWGDTGVSSMVLPLTDTFFSSDFFSISSSILQHPLVDCSLWVVVTYATFSCRSKLSSDACSAWWMGFKMVGKSADPWSFPFLLFMCLKCKHTVILNMAVISYEVPHPSNDECNNEQYNKHNMPLLCWCTADTKKCNKLTQTHINIPPPQYI